MKPPLIAVLCVAALSLSLIATQFDYVIQDLGSVEFTASLWKRCIVRTGTGSEVCSADFSFCRELDDRIKAGRAFSVLACFVAALAAGLACARVPFASLREKHQQRALFVLLGVSCLFCIIVFSISFPLFTESYCDKPSHRDSNNAVLGAQPFLHVAAALVFAAVMAAERWLQDDINLVGRIDYFRRSGTSSNTLVNALAAATEEERLRLENQDGSEQITVRFTLRGDDGDGADMDDASPTRSVASRPSAVAAEASTSWTLL